MLKFGFWFFAKISLNPTPIQVKIAPPGIIPRYVVRKNRFNETSNNAGAILATAKGITGMRRIKKR